MPSRKILYAREYPINDKIKIVIPTVGQVLDQEDNYYSLISTITATPYDMMVQLDDVGINFNDIDEYQLFTMIFTSLKTWDTSLVFGDLDISKFELMVNTENNTVVIYDQENDITIDKSIYFMICEAIRKINSLERRNKKAGNAEANRYLLDRARRKLKRARTKVEDSQLEGLIVAMVNTGKFPYNFETVRDITIYQFNESLQQVVKLTNVHHRLNGVYCGTVSAKDMKPDDLNWLNHK